MAVVIDRMHLNGCRGDGGGGGDLFEGEDLKEIPSRKKFRVMCLTVRKCEHASKTTLCDATARSSPAELNRTTRISRLSLSLSISLLLLPSSPSLSLSFSRTRCAFKKNNGDKSRNYVGLDCAQVCEISASNYETGEELCPLGNRLVLLSFLINRRRFT